MKYTMILLLPLAVFGLGACTGPMGPQGNRGTAGARGAKGKTGTDGTGGSTIVVVPPPR